MPHVFAKKKKITIYCILIHVFGLIQWSKEKMLGHSFHS